MKKGIKRDKIRAVWEDYLERHGSGKKAIFIHGAAWNRTLWKRQKDFLSNFMEVILLDLPGHGNSSRPGLSSVEEYVDFLFEVIVSHSLEGSFLVGHSLGGAIAMASALRRSDLFRGLVIIGSGARLKVLPQILEGIEKDKERTIDLISSFAFSKKADYSLVMESKVEMMKCPKDVIYGDFLSCDKFDIMDNVKSIQIPVLIVCGLEDRLTPPKYSYYLNNEIRGSKLVLIEDAGHMVMLEKPQALNLAIKTFVEEV